MPHKRITSILSVSIWALAGWGSSVALAQDITGAGASFPAPIYSK